MHKIPTHSLIRVLPLDTLPLVHVGVQQLLADFPDLAVVGAARSCSEALQVATRCAPHILLIEIADLGVGWPTTLRNLARSLPSAHMVVFTGTAKSRLFEEALQAGVQGYLLKNIAAFDLAQALRRVAIGQRVFAPELSADSQRDPLRDRFALSKREREVLTLLAHGLSNNEIAGRLHLSSSTVKFHCGGLFKKLGVANRAQAIARAYTYQIELSPYG
jgi:DNA-binding NarL/FixJ family response regulator